MNIKLSDSQMEELREIFKAEANEQIRAIAKILIPLSDEGLGAEDLLDQLGQCFIAAHAIKGSASTVGCARIAGLAAKLESALRETTEGQSDLTKELVDIFLEILEAIRIGVASPTSDTDEVTDADRRIFAEIDAVLQEQTRVGRPSSISIQPPPYVPGSDSSSPPGGPLRGDQMQYLLSVFQAEASEHIKALAELLFKLEEGQGDTTQTLVEAFREAHSLKGSSGTIGFERVAAVTHAMEDVLGVLKADPSKVSSEIIDTLLDTLDLIRRSVKDSAMGDAELKPREAAMVRSLRAIVERSASQGTTSSPKKMVPAKKKDEAPPPPSGQERETESNSPSSALPEPEFAQESAGRDAFIRVSQEAINNLVAQVGELFEAHLYLSSTTPTIRKLEEHANEIAKHTATLSSHLYAYNDKLGEETAAVLNKVKSLGTSLGTLGNRFSLDERQFSKLIQNSQEGLRQIRMAPISTIFVMIRRQVREICRLTGKRVELFLDGGEYAVDRKVLEAIEDPLIHLLRNAVDHGIEDTEGRRAAGKSEKGRINVVARHVGDGVELSISDDGRGIDPENIRKSLREKNLMDETEIQKLTDDQLLDCLFESGFTTQRDVSKISGRGVGLDVVKYTMERLGGEVRLSAFPGTGTEFSLRLPLSISTLRCLLVQVANRVLAIPASNVEKVLLQETNATRVIGGGEVITYQEQHVPICSLGDLLHLKTPGAHSGREEGIVVVITFGERRFALRVDDIVEYTQLILRPLGDILERVSYVSGISLLGTGEIALVLNPSDLVRASGSSYVKRARERSVIPAGPGEMARVLVVDDSLATRTLEKAFLESAGYAVVTASDGLKALEILDTQKCDIVVSDIQMPNMDGLTLAQTIKTQYRFLQLPVILVSSLGSDEDKERGMASGADAYIVKKELSQSELVETIEQLL